MIRNRPQRVVEPVTRRPVLVSNFTQAGEHVLHESLGEAWRREVSKRPSARRRIRTRRPNRHHPHTTTASIGRQRTDRSSNDIGLNLRRWWGSKRGPTRPSFRVSGAHARDRWTRAPRRRSCRPSRGRPPSGAARPTRPGSRRRRSGSPAYACSASDTPTPTSTGRSVIALTRAASAVADAASCVRSPVTPEQADRVDEAARASGDARQAFVGRGRRRQHHRLDALVIGRAAPRLGLLERQVRQDAPGDAGLDQPMGEAAVAVVMDDVVVGHHDQRDVDVECWAPRRAPTAASRRRRARPAMPVGSPARPSPDRRTGCRSRSRRRRWRRLPGSRPPNPG